MIDYIDNGNATYSSHDTWLRGVTKNFLFI